MADYIDKNILSQAYIHVEPSKQLNINELKEFQAHIKEFSRSRVDFFLHPGLEIQIAFEEGSIIARITVIGALSLLLQGVCNYPSFKEGVGAIYSDSKRLAEYIVSEAQFHSGSKHGDIIRLEARTGVIGSLHKITLKLDSIKRSAGGALTASELSEKLLDAAEEINQLISVLEEPQDIVLVKAGIKELIDAIPTAPTPPIGKANSPISVVVYSTRLKSLKATVSN